MKRNPALAGSWRRSALACGVGLTLALANMRAEALAPLVTRTIRDIKLTTPSGSVGAAKPTVSVPDGGSLHSGVESRAEIGFGARALVRLGGKSALRFEQQGRGLELQEGAVLFQAGGNGGAPKIRTGGITVVTAGATGIIERYGSAYAKILVLEGTARVYLRKIGESVLVNAGQMLITTPAAQTLPEPVHFEIAQLYKTSVLTGSGFAPLASRGRIEEEIRKQQSDPEFTRTNLVIYGRGTLVNLVPPTPTPAGPMPSPSPGGNLKPTTKSRP